MDLSNSTHLCRLCLQTSEDVLNIWTILQDSTIATILAKHFWFQIKKNDGLTEWLCAICWEQTKAFHEFYERVERLQKSYWDSIKSDGGGNDESIGLEPDLSIVKYEESELALQVTGLQVSEADDFDYNDDCDDDDVSKERQTSSNDDSQPSDKASQSDDNRKVSTKGKIGSANNSDKSVNQTIREEHNRELNGKIREWFTMKCDICNEGEFDTWYGVKRHYRKKHQTNGYLKCCDKKFHLRCEVLDHIRYHLPLESAAVDPKIAAVDPKIAAVDPKIAAVEAKIYEWFTMKCDICNDHTFKTLLDVRRHYRTVHKVRGYLTCCSRKFDKRHAMAAHMRSHTNPDEYYCEQCDRSFSTKHSLKNHIAHHEPLDSRAFKCNLCSSSFAREAMLTVHIRNKHTSKNGQQFPCDKCNKTYRSELLLKCHIRTHDSLSYVCEVCARQFKSKQNFRYHVTSEHSTKPPPKVQCDICGHWLKNDHILNLHVKHIHQDNEPKKCHICQKVCSNKLRLRKHISYVHGKKNYRCTLCDKTFGRSRTLKEHVATHTGEDLYKCQHCDKKFKFGGNLSKHMKNKHLSEWTRNIERKMSGDNENVTQGSTIKVK